METEEGIDSGIGEEIGSEGGIIGTGIISSEEGEEGETEGETMISTTEEMIEISEEEIEIITIETEITGNIERDQTNENFYFHSLNQNKRIRQLTYFPISTPGLVLGLAYLYPLFLFTNTFLI